MPKFIVKFRGVYENSRDLIIKANCKRDAMIIFNNRFRNKRVEIYSIKEYVEPEEVSNEQSNIERFESDTVRTTREVK